MGGLDSAKVYDVPWIKSKNDDCDKPKLFAAIIKIHDDVNERVYYSYMMEKQFKCGS